MFFKPEFSGTYKGFPMHLGLLKSTYGEGGSLDSNALLFEVKNIFPDFHANDKHTYYVFGKFREFKTFTGKWVLCQYGQEQNKQEIETILNTTPVFKMLERFSKIAYEKNVNYTVYFNKNKITIAIDKLSIISRILVEEPDYEIVKKTADTVCELWNR